MFCNILTIVPHIKEIIDLLWAHTFESLLFEKYTMSE